MAIRVLEGPAVEPVSLTEARGYLRIDWGGGRRGAGLFPEGGARAV